jgi:hypothetical protein
MKRRYNLVKMGASSSKYGNCEICGEPVADVCMQTIEYKSSYNGWMYGSSTFGHEDCLVGIRK